MTNYTLTAVCFFFLASPSSFEATAQGSSRPSKPISIAAADTLYFAGHWEKAKAGYEAHVAHSETISALTWMRLGYCYHNLGSYTAALKNYQRAMDAKPTTQLKPYLMSRMARSYARLNNNSNSLAWLDSAARAGYGTIQEMDTLADYKSVRNDPGFKKVYRAVQANVYPCMANPRNREFDFWVGEWDVYQTGTNGPVVGHSLIQNVAGGCLILENWTALPATQEGKSMNYYDPSTGKWEQVWMGSGGGLTKFINGEYRDGAMRFTFDAVQPDGKKVPGRFTFFNMGPEQVRQFNEQSLDGGKTWQSVYDLTYVRKKK